MRCEASRSTTRGIAVVARYGARRVSYPCAAAHAPHLLACGTVARQGTCFAERYPDPAYVPVSLSLASRVVAVCHSPARWPESHRFRSGRIGPVPASNLRHARAFAETHITLCFPNSHERREHGSVGSASQIVP